MRLTPLEECKWLELLLYAPCQGDPKDSLQIRKVAVEQIRDHIKTLEQENQQLRKGREHA